MWNTGASRSADRGHYMGQSGDRIARYSCPALGACIPLLGNHLKEEKLVHQRRPRPHAHRSAVSRVGTQHHPGPAMRNAEQDWLWTRGCCSPMKHGRQTFTERHCASGKSQTGKRCDPFLDADIFREILEH